MSSPLVAADATNVRLPREERGGSPGRTGWKVVNRYVPRIAPSTASLIKSTQPAMSNAAFGAPLRLEELRRRAARRAHGLAADLRLVAQPDVEPVLAVEQ